MNLCGVKVKPRISSKHTTIYYIHMVPLTVDRISSSADGGSMSWPAMEIGEVSPRATNSLIATRSRSPSFGSGDDCLSNRVVYQLSDHCFGVNRRSAWIVSAHSRAISSGGGTRPARTSDSSKNDGFSQGFGPSREEDRGRYGKSVLSIIEPAPSTTILP